ncbi:MAG: SOS response-associated peptidase [Burkholderiales bacterium]
MCGRFVLYSSKERIADRFGVDPSSLNLITHWEARYNIAPSTRCLIVRPSDLGWREMVTVSWGLLPHWAKSAADRRYINARGETIFEKPVFRAAARHKRCLVIADGYYEWKATGGRKIPYFFSMADEQPFAMAGMWDSWERERDRIESFAIITTKANELSAAVHDRMPAILKPEDYDLWLDNKAADTARLALLVAPYAANSMQCWTVSIKVGDPKNETPELIKPVK